MATDYATLRKEINECQGAALTKLKKPTLKKAKVPKTPGLPPAFWVYVMGAQVEYWSWSLPLEPDPEICTEAITGQRFTVVSPVPTGTTLSNGVGNTIGVKAKSTFVNVAWGQGSDCDADNGGGSVDSVVAFDFNTSSIRLNASLGGGLEWAYPNDSDSVFLRKFTPKEKADLLNPRKGVLSYELSYVGAGDARTDTGTCTGWGDDGTCTWADSWTLRVILVRAEPMDLVRGP